MRHPGMQYLDRLEKTAAKYAGVRGEYMACLGQVSRLENELTLAKVTLEKAHQDVMVIRGVMIRLLEAEAITSFGLPGDISREEFESKIRSID